MAACTPVPPAPGQSGPAQGTSAATAGITSDVATGLDAPWSMVALGDGHLLVSERDSGQILDVAPDGAKLVVGTVPGVVHQGEGGLLGLAVRLGGCDGNPEPNPDTGCLDVYAYFTSGSDNRIVRMPLLGGAGRRSLGAPTVILSGIAKAGNHNGGRLAFGPDGMLYISSGDAGNSAAAQDRSSMSGKILRLTPDGSIPADNPFPNSPVWSLGHRNVQGIAWDGQGRMWASEFGQNTWDELNEVKAGANYGWPVVEGIGPDPSFTNPVLQWTTDEASPSGIAISGTTLYMAALRGERLWVIDLAGTPRATSTLVGALGRLRDVALTGDGRLYVLTNNTDGRGNPNDGDDRIVAVPK
ncbi:Glucose/arabinose dehydrogenase, beta-propeller fold [Arthrobacter alpinus]|uniref:Glucose/arabinose dehydrogenase, beta-propeller fold n=1 Tax=Arthrobacter alpinus TaxID=656366 RepID=A0A1H5JAL7_9MICC|nr:PQQ-dependent sugar dehydrogenase [Arthrobacter alpinus]SEE49575.1 Glucose/arabinose dehydrogenase, beta-propeller fold [Arthrobacter alpinus]